MNQKLHVPGTVNQTTYLQASFFIKRSEEKNEGVYAVSKGDFCKVSVLKKIIKPPILRISEVAENSKMLILFFPLILCLITHFLELEGYGP